MCHDKIAIKTKEQCAVEMFKEMLTSLCLQQRFVQISLDQFFLERMKFASFVSGDSGQAI